MILRLEALIPPILGLHCFGFYTATFYFIVYSLVVFILDSCFSFSIWMQLKRHFLAQTQKHIYTHTKTTNTLNNILKNASIGSFLEITTVCFWDVTIKVNLGIFQILYVFNFVEKNFQIFSIAVLMTLAWVL